MARSRPVHARGFTLVELVVVVAIVALLGASVVLAVPGDDHVLARDADRFALHLRQARDEAVLGGRAVRVRIDGQGYDFARRMPGGWDPLRAGPFEAIAWSDGIRPVPGDAEAATFLFDETGGVAPGAVSLASGGARLTVAIGADGTARVQTGG